MKTQLDKRTIVAATVTLVCWASAFAGIRASLSVYTPGQIALMRFLVASVVLAVYAVITRMPLPKKQDLGAITIIGVLGITAYHLLLNYGQLTVRGLRENRIPVSVEERRRKKAQLLL